MTAIVGGWDTEAELPVDGAVGHGPKTGQVGKVAGAKAGGPGLYMIEPSGLYWVIVMMPLYGLLINLYLGLLRCRDWQGPADRQG